MNLGKRKVLVASVAALLAAAVVAGALFTSGGPVAVAQPTTVSRPEPAADSSRDLSLEASLGEAEVSNMVNILKTAILRGDDSTREAMLEGLKGEPQRAERILRREIERSKDERLARGLEIALESIRKP